MHAVVKQIAREMPQMLSDSSETVPGNALVLVCPIQPATEPRDGLESVGGRLTTDCIPHRPAQSDGLHTVGR